MSGIYLHIPFCKQACSYCDFYFVTRTTEREQFVKRLLGEIKGYSDTAFVEEPVQTIYFGGGTPSLLEPSQIEAILNTLDEVFNLEIRELTFEMNPDDVSKDFLYDLKQLGVNRPSMGIQTFQPELLTFMNRAHTREEALKSLQLLSSTGFESFTVDLIYGNPHQDLDDLSEDLKILLRYEPPHISAYSLTIEPRTRLGKQVELGRIAPPEDDKVADHFKMINRRFREANIERYEVSNYSQAGHEAIHNSSYWNHANYLGLGPGAHSFWWENEAQRWENKPDLRSYVADTGIVGEKETLSLTQLAEERLLMGLRTREGVGIKELSKRYGYSFSNKQLNYLHMRQDENKLTIDDRIVLSDKGILIADAIILDLVTLH